MYALYIRQLFFLDRDGLVLHRRLLTKKDDRLKIRYSDTENYRTITSGIRKLTEHENYMNCFILH